MRYRLDRALQILHLLQGDAHYDPVKLTVELGVNRRTVYRDIALLREMGIDVVFNHEAGHYVIERGTGEQRRGVKTAQLRAAYNNAMSDLETTASVESIIRRVAHCLAGNPTTSGSPVDTGMNASQAPSSHFSQQDVPNPTGGDETDQPTTTNAPDRTTSRSTSSSWLQTIESLPLLRHAVQVGAIIETCDSDPADAELAGRSICQLKPVEFLVNRKGVIVTGVDARGQLVRTDSCSIRLIEQKASSRTSPRTKQSWHQSNP